MGTEVLYPLLKSIHATSMTIALTLSVLRELLILASAYLQSAPRLYSWSRGVSTISEPLSLLGLAAGIATVLAGGWHPLTPWLVLAYVLIILTFVIGGTMIKPWQKRVAVAINSPEGASTTQLQQLLRERRALAGRWLVLLVLVGILMVMRTKPSFSNFFPIEANGGTQTNVVSAAPTSASSTQVEADVTYTLKTVMGGNPSLSFVGIGGEIEGAVNPTLVANVGDVISITLINSHAMPHDLTIEGIHVTTGQLSNAGQQVTIQFTVTEAGTFTYSCSLPGHREAGMRGILYVEAS